MSITWNVLPALPESTAMINYILDFEALPRWPQLIRSGMGICRKSSQFIDRAENHYFVKNKKPCSNRDDSNYLDLSDVPSLRNLTWEYEKNQLDSNRNRSRLIQRETDIFRIASKWWCGQGTQICLGPQLHRIQYQWEQA